MWGWQNRIYRIGGKAMDTILEMKHIVKTFPGVRAVDDVSISVKKGEVYALLGENGAGKSTLMKILDGIQPADSGEIIFDGQKVNIKSPSDALKLGISMIFQELNPIPELTIAENLFAGIRFPRKMCGIVDWKAAYQKSEELFKRWGLNYDPRKKMKSLSLADCQMIEIIKAISYNAKLIIMDEPSSSLTEKEVGKLFEFIRELKKEGISIIIITHKLDEVYAITDTVAVMRDGKYIGSKPTKEITRAEMIRMMVGRDIKEVYKEKDYEIGDVVLSVKNLKRGRMVNDVSFEVHQGEILGFSGIVGAGRTETMRCIFGLDRAESGTVLLDGQPIRVKEPHDAIHQGIMMVTEDRKKDGLVLIRSIYENMLLPSTYRKSNKGILNKKNESRDVDKYYKELEVKAPSINVITNQLSGGNQQKVIIAKWLMMNPKVLIMDEPTRGIDILAKSEIYRIMRELAKKGVAIILVSSDMEEVLGVSDRIAVMCQGQITGFLDREEFDQEKIMEYATAIG